MSQVKQLYILCVMLTCLSSYDFPNGQITKLKFASVLFILAAFLDFCIRFKTERLKTIKKYFLEYNKYIYLLVVVTLVIYAFNITDISTIKRGVEKIFFQLLTVLLSISAFYEFGEKSVDYAWKGTMLFSVLSLGLAFKQIGSLSQIVGDITTFITTGGDQAIGYMKLLEVHEVTFTIGLFILYYFVNNPKKHVKEVLLSIFFFCTGLKRSGIMAVFLALALYYLLRNQPMKVIQRVTLAIGIGFFAFSLFYVWFVRSGLFVYLMNELKVDMSGRQNLYAYIEDFYKISPFYLGHGFESVTRILRSAGDIKVNETYISRLNALHNDFLTMYIEMGFWGFLGWSYYKFIDYVQFTKQFGEKAYLIATMATIYLGITYMTDNTSKYFLLTFMLWLLPCATGTACS